MRPRPLREESCFYFFFGIFAPRLAHCNESGFETKRLRQRKMTVEMDMSFFSLPLCSSFFSTGEPSFSGCIWRHRPHAFFLSFSCGNGEWVHGLGRRERSLEALGRLSRWQYASCCILGPAAMYLSIYCVYIYGAYAQKEKKRGTESRFETKDYDRTSGTRARFFPRSRVLTMGSFSDPGWIYKRCVWVCIRNKKGAHLSQHFPCSPARLVRRPVDQA